MNYRHFDKTAQILKDIETVKNKNKMEKSNELPNIEKMQLIPAIGISCTGCELIKYGRATKNGHIAKCIELAGNGCLDGFIWKNKTV